MREPRLLLVLLLTALLASAGCVATASITDPASAAATMSGGFFASATPLWTDPQNAPHPAWNWPTLAYPAQGAGVPASWAPVPAAPDPGAIEGLQYVARAPGVTRGAGIALFGSLAVVPGFTTDTKVVDVTDPTKPTVLSTIQGRHRGAGIIAYPEGRLVAVFATNSNIESYDITNPALPDRLPDLNPSSGSHKLGVVPGTPIVYNANSDGPNAVMEIFDLTDPEAPVLVKAFRPGGCHHVYFWIDHASSRERSICAGLSRTLILDIEDPRNPVVLITVPHPVGGPIAGPALSPATLSHFAILSEDGDTLIVGDETGGGIAPACDVHAQTDVFSVSGPLGSLWFFDVSDGSTATLLGWFNAGQHWTKNPTGSTSCTAHHGRLVPDPLGGRDLIAMAYYGAGSVLIDFTDPSMARIVDQHAVGTDTWEVAHNRGWIMTGDLRRGFEVLQLR